MTNEFPTNLNLITKAVRIIETKPKRKKKGSDKIVSKKKINEH